MKNKNHMKTFPPQSHFLFCFKPSKQNKKTSKKICFFLRSLNVEKRVLKFNLYTNNSDITPEENTSGEIFVPLYRRNSQSMSKKTGDEKVEKQQEAPLTLNNGIISTFFSKVKVEFDSGLAVLFSRKTTFYIV